MNKSDFDESIALMEKDIENIEEVLNADKRYYQYYLNLAYKVIDEKKVAIADLQKELDQKQIAVVSSFKKITELRKEVQHLQKKQDN